MRMVSWIVVLGALAWLLYMQLGPRFAGDQLPGIPPELVSGTAAPSARKENAPDGRAPDGNAQDTNPVREGVALLPYERVYPMLEATRVVESLDRIDATAIVRSRQRGVGPEDILLTLDDGEQMHHFTVGQYGEVNLPMVDAWRDERRMIRSNQPPDSLDLQVTFIMRALPGPRVDYAWLWESATQMNTALAALQKVNPGPVQDVVGIQFEFEPGVQGVLQAGEGETAALLRTDERGFIRLEMSRELLDSNPSLAFNPLPERMVPLLAPPPTPTDGS